MKKKTIKSKKKPVIYINPDPIEAYKQGWKDGRTDLVRVMSEFKL